LGTDSEQPSAGGDLKLPSCHGAKRPNTDRSIILPNILTLQGFFMKTRRSAAGKEKKQLRGSPPIQLISTKREFSDVQKNHLNQSFARVQVTVRSEPHQK